MGNSNTKFNFVRAKLDAAAQKILELNGMLILIDTLRLLFIIGSLKSTLCKLRF